MAVLFRDVPSTERRLRYQLILRSQRRYLRQSLPSLARKLDAGPRAMHFDPANKLPRVEYHVASTSNVASRKVCDLPAGSRVDGCKHARLDQRETSRRRSGP